MPDQLESYLLRSLGLTPRGSTAIEGLKWLSLRNLSAAVVAKLMPNNEKPKHERKTKPEFPMFWPVPTDFRLVSLDLLWVLG